MWITGRPLAMADALNAETLMKLLGGLPLGKEQCAELAVRALKRAEKEWTSAPSPPAPLPKTGEG